MIRFLRREALLVCVLLSLSAAMPGRGSASVTIPGQDVTFTGKVPMEAFLRESPGPNATTHLDVWEVRQGHVITAYDIDMTKVMHMIVASDDLSDFRHVHPVLQPDGHLTIDLSLPEQPGGYHVYIDALPHGVGRQVFRFDLPGQGASTRPRVLHRQGGTVSVGPYSVTISPTRVPFGEIATISVRISKDGHPATDLHPYLGVMAHGVFIGTKDLTYMHAHGMTDEMLNMSSANDCGDGMMMAMTPMPPDLNIGNEFEFEILAPSAQAYDFWLQFVGGKTVYTAPFLVTTI
jgi:hypothetical protein